MLFALFPVISFYFPVSPKTLFKILPGGGFRVSHGLPAVSGTTANNFK